MNRSPVPILLIGVVATVICCSAIASGIRVERLNDGRPVVEESMFVALGASAYEGANINGPSVIRVPKWLPPEARVHPNARYYLYFAHHKGHYIRLAWAVNVAGPWRLHNVGSGVRIGSRGVLDMGEPCSGVAELPIGNGLVIFDHIASPDVHVDSEQRQIILYFHGPARHEGRRIGQKTFAAVSTSGLDFNGNVQPVALGRSYFRVFQHRGGLYALANNGDIYQAPSATAPWKVPTGFDFAAELWRKRGDNPWTSDLRDDGIEKVVLRHTTVRMTGNRLDVLYTCVGDAPERIMHSQLDVSSSDVARWDPSYSPQLVLRAELGWEGAGIPPKPSAFNIAPENVNQLRDPYLFQDNDGAWNMFYAGRGEDALGVARVWFVKHY